MKKTFKGNKANLLLGKLPPQNAEAEESLLSAILIDNSVINDVVEILTPEDFYRTRHQIIFRSIFELFENKEPVDLVTLTNQLQQNNALEEIGGASFLSRLAESNV